jgi:N-acetylglucosamine kinase-like BadF-type ATPase
MQLIADSGSTKTDWRLIRDDDTIEQCSTEGLNPLFVNEERFLAVVHDDFPAAWSKGGIDSIYFYGAGCASARQKGLVTNWLSILFPEARSHVESDLLGAAISVCGHEAGVVGIMGTGSNSCLFDGKAIINRVPPLGYVLGDEGSGSALGKALLRGYMRRQLPTEISLLFEQEFGSDTDFLKRVYVGDKPNEYLASFARFMGDHQKNPFIAKMILQCFDEFLDLVVQLETKEIKTANFVGSIAYNFSTLLNKSVKEHGLVMGKIVRSPIAGLAVHHLENRL